MLCCIAGLGLGSIASFFAWKRPSARTVLICLSILIAAAMSWHLSSVAGRSHHLSAFDPRSSLARAWLLG